ncbi:MAG: hypothetical protein ACYCVD_00885 [Desulfitobacteriaceae bacterium]
MNRVALTGGQILTPGGNFISATLLIERTQILGIDIGEVSDEFDRVDVSGCIVSPSYN